jgi:hypothetical protein
MGNIKVQVKFSRNNLLHYDIVGIEVPYEALTVGDLTDRIAETEAHLSRITGLEVKIETAME